MWVVQTNSQLEGFKALDKSSSSFDFNSFTEGNYITYPFVPDGSDERQYSSPGIKLYHSIHKSKYYEYKEYHSSEDNLEFISSKYILECIMCI